MSLIPEIREGQSIELLKALHILTRDGKINQDTRRKLKQVYHLFQFIEPLMKDIFDHQDTLNLVDHGAGKSYLGFILYDLFLKNFPQAHVYGIETRHDLIVNAQSLAKKIGFEQGMSFLEMNTADSFHHPSLPEKVDIVTALHACNTATDDALKFALIHQAKYVVLVPCCQAEVAAVFRKLKGHTLGKTPLSEIWRHPLHSREFGSHLTNVLRCLQLEAHGYQVTVTELVGWEHSMKNELIIAKSKHSARQRQLAILQEMNLDCLKERFAYDL
ncbi:class I SAM-dependent methyltransferase [Basilea psittacipulmonis]|uniref:SAM-dependent methyltransferase n=1 Tax=Basilea psittacipulmonis DSM 24701 TaxID=1072685 RepID=A0A077DJT2_9BURK|nr:SAM-dependent methyltransferase [Basilea psittacipulmonis]AIL33353.1 SAM-dependent methyltransferase [Basilea psittacipulmonis DSM 24701]